MDLEKFRHLLQQPEPENVKTDFKIKLYDINHLDPKVRNMQWDEFIKDVLALANGNVGTAKTEGNLIIGVADKLNQQNTRSLYDVGEVKLSAQQILQKVNAACNPPLPDLDLQTITFEGTRILVVSIPPTPYLHETTRALKTPKTNYQENTVFIRRKEGTGLASTAERQAIIAEKQSLLMKVAIHDGSNSESARFSLDLIQKHRERVAEYSKYARWTEESPYESYIDSSGVHLPVFASPYEDSEGSSEELQQCICSYQRLLVLGEPGMGKTVALERATWECASSRIIKVPAFIPLIQYDGNLMDMVRVSLNETGVLRIKNTSELEFLIREYEFVFFFDGLNEVAKNNREKLFVELAAFLRTYPSSPCIITSRSQDELWRRFHSREMIEAAVVIRRITDEQIGRYLTAHLGERDGQELHDRLNKALLGLARIPLLLWLIKEAGLAGEELPGNRGELFNRFIAQVLKREQKQPDLATTPSHEKIKALGHLAFHLHQDHRLSCSREDAIRVVHNECKDLDSSSVIDESLRNGLLLGEKQLHFMHQAVHEHFVALKIEGLISPITLPTKGAIAKLTSYSSDVTLKRQIRLWAKEDWWSEVIVQLAGITEQPMFLSKQVLLSNPWLAYWCSIEGQPLTEEMQSQIEKQTVYRLQSAKIDERQRVVSELVRMENPRTIKYLIIAISDTVITIQELASQTLVRLGEPSVDPLLDSLKSAVEEARWATTRTLGMIWRFHEISNLGAEDAYTRQRATKVLGNLGDTRAVLPLIAALNDSNETVRNGAAQSLGKLSDSRAIDPLMRALEKSYARAHSYESATIAEALSGIGNPSEEPLLTGIRDADITVRQRAFIALGRAWTLPIIANLASDDPRIRREAARKLGRLSDQRVLAPLLAILLDSDQSVRWEATSALGSIWQLSALVHLGHADASIREDATISLGRQGDTRVIEPLIASLRDQDYRVRASAAEALGHLGEGAVEALASLLSHNDREVRRSVSRALTRIKDHRILDILAIAMKDHRWWVRETAADCLAKLGEPAVPILETALGSNDPDIRNLASVALHRNQTVAAQTILYFTRVGKLKKGKQ